MATVNNSGKALNLSSGSTLESASFAVGGTDRVLYVAVASGDGVPTVPTAVRWGGSGGTLLTQIGTSLAIISGGAGIYWTLWRLIAPAATSTTIHATWGGAQVARWMGFIAVAGADQTAPNGTVAQATGTNTTPTASASGSSGQLVLDFMAFLSNVTTNITASVGAGQTSLQAYNGADLFGIAGIGLSSETASGASTTMSWALSATPSDGWATYALAIADAGGGGSTAHIPAYLQMLRSNQ